MSRFAWVIIGIIVVVVLWLIGTFNALVRMRNRMREALSDIDVQSKRRYDLIPNLIETVKGYAKFEKSVLENVTKARAAVATGGDTLAKEGAENVLSGTLKTLFAVSEGYPELKANQNFLHLQQELADTENKMMAARRFHNNTVMDLNTKIESFPANMVAGMFGFSQSKFFETANEAEKQPVKVQF